MQHRKVQKQKNFFEKCDNKMQAQTQYIALTSYIYITIYLCIATNLTCANPTNNKENNYEITHSKLSTWDLYNLLKQKFRR